MAFGNCTVNEEKRDLNAFAGFYRFIDLYIQCAAFPSVLFGIATLRGPCRNFQPFSVSKRTQVQSVAGTRDAAPVPLITRLRVSLSTGNSGPRVPHRRIAQWTTLCS